MENKNDEFNNYILIKYYIFCTLFQTLWSLGVLGFTVFAVLYFQSYWALLLLLLIGIRVYVKLYIDEKIKKIQDPKAYGTNTPK